MLIVLYVGTIVAANWALQTFGIADFWGVGIPTGTLFAGLSFTVRDYVQEQHGRIASVLAIFLGAAVSWIISPAFAFASFWAFLVSELVDMLIYTPLRKRGFMRAVVASNAVGYVLDSILFLLLAFGSLNFLAGQLIGKTISLFICMPLLQPRK